MNIQNLRLSAKNKTQILIKDAKKSIERNNQAILGSEDSREITKRKGHNRDLEEKIIDLEIRLSDIISGNLDEELMDEVVKCVKKPIKPKVTIVPTIPKNSHEIATTQQANKWEISNTYKFFSRLLPGYMEKKLSEMPNNKGFIQNGIRYFGKLPAENGPTVLLEKLDGDILRIHEQTKTDWKIYEKIGSGQKKCIQSGYLRG